METKLARTSHHENGKIVNKKLWRASSDKKKSNFWSRIAISESKCRSTYSGGFLENTANVNIYTDGY
jgi:hypothetical protein